MAKNKAIVLAVVGAAVVGAILYLESQKPERQKSQEVLIMPRVESMNKQEKAKRYELAKELVNPAGFINTDKITVSELIGKKVVLIDFWTYSCINCQRTTPYLNAWYEKYKDKGLEIIGVHTPEFEFEKKYENVLAAVKKFNIKYPNVLDNDYATWTAYSNRYWPHKYLIDIDGFIVYDHIGEGAYEETERKIQELLEERMAALGQEGGIAAGIEKPANAPQVDFSKVGSPEIYFGASRNEFLANGRSGIVGQQLLSVPEQVEINKLYLVGNWDIQREFAENKNQGAKIIFRYNAKNVYLVASSPSGVDLTVFIDGKKLGELFVREDQLYNIFLGSDYGEHNLEILIDKPGLKAFAFTFG